MAFEGPHSEPTVHRTFLVGDARRPGAEQLSAYHPYWK
jgi:hypothetical protein